MALHNELENSAPNVEKELHGTTVVSASYGIMTPTRAYITATTVAYVERAVDLGRTSFIARFVASPSLYYSQLTTRSRRVVYVCPCLWSIPISA